jgi:hypothetical protein
VITIASPAVVRRVSAGVAALACTAGIIVAQTASPAATTHQAIMCPLTSNVHAASSTLRIAPRPSCGPVLVE